MAGALTDDDFDQFAAALWIVQQSSRYNMLMDGPDAFTAAMCVAALLGHAELVAQLNIVGGAKQHLDLVKRWMATYPANHTRWQAIAEASPLGHRHADALERNLHRFAPTPPGPLGRTKLVRDFSRYHGFSWYSALVDYAEQECYRKGSAARDQLEMLRGVSAVPLIKAAGAQLVAREGQWV
jgi:hypothetical protein